MKMTNFIFKSLLIVALLLDLWIIYSMVNILMPDKQVDDKILFTLALLIFSYVSVILIIVIVKELFTKSNKTKKDNTDSITIYEFIEAMLEAYDLYKEENGYLNDEFGEDPLRFINTIPKDRIDVQKLNNFTAIVSQEGYVLLHHDFYGKVFVDINSANLYIFQGEYNYEEDGISFRIIP